MKIDAARLVTQMHAGDPIAEMLGIELVSVSSDAVTVQMRIATNHLGGHAVAHGGILFTLADVAMSYVSNRSNIQAVATHCAIDFLEAVKSGDLVVAKAREINSKSKSAIYDVEMTVSDRVVGQFRGNTLRVGGLVTDLYGVPPELS